MTSDTARRLAEEKYPTTGFPSSPGGRQRLRDHEVELRAAFLAGWDAAIEAAADAVNAECDRYGQNDEGWPWQALSRALAAIRAERSDR